MALSGDGLEGEHIRRRARTHPLGADGAWLSVAFHVGFEGDAEVDRAKARVLGDPRGRPVAAVREKVHARDLPRVAPGQNVLQTLEGQPVLGDARDPDAEKARVPLEEFTRIARRAHYAFAVV